MSGNRKQSVNNMHTVFTRQQMFGGGNVGEAQRPKSSSSSSSSSSSTQAQAHRRPRRRQVLLQLQQRARNQAHQVLEPDLQ